MSELQANGGRQTETQNSGAHGIEGARLVESDVAVKVALRGGTFLGDDRVARKKLAQRVENESGGHGMLGLRLGLFGSRGRAALDRFHAAGDVLRGGGDIADDAAAGESGGGVLRRIGDLKQLCAGRDGVAGNEGVIEKNGGAENDDGVISGELGGERFLRWQQAAAKQAMRARKCPA